MRIRKAVIGVTAAALLSLGTVGLTAGSAQAVSGPGCTAYEYDEAQGDYYMALYNIYVSQISIDNNADILAIEAHDQAETWYDKASIALQRC